MAKPYIDNEKFFSALVSHRENYLKAIEEGRETPQISNYIGECFIKIANNFSNRGDFITLPYKEEIIGDAIENMVIAAHKFDSEKSKNPFSYFTQITFFAFLRHIIKENKQLKLKYKILAGYDLDLIVEKSEDDDFNSYIQDTIKKQNDYNKYYSHIENEKQKEKEKNKKPRKKRETKKVGLEDILSWHTLYNVVV